MSNQGNEFWEQYQKDYAHIDMGAMLEAYADARESKEIAELKQWQDEAIRLTSEVQNMYAIDLEQQSEIKRLREGIQKEIDFQDSQTDPNNVGELKPSHIRIAVATVLRSLLIAPAPVTEDEFSASAYPKECTPTINHLTETDDLTMMQRLEKRMPPFHKIDSPLNEDQE